MSRLEENPNFIYSNEYDGIENIVEVRLWSDSDFDRIKDLLTEFTNNNIKYILTIKSAHRTPDLMAEAAKAFPDLLLPIELLSEIDSTRYKIKVCIAWAWWAAHIAWMTASETTIPVIALSLVSSSMWNIDSFLSMCNMPPGIPNLAMIDQKEASLMAEKILYFDEWEDYNKVAIDVPDICKWFIDYELLEQLWLEIGNDSDVKIHIKDLDSDSVEDFTDNEISIIIPISYEKLDLMNKELTDEDIIRKVKKLQKFNYGKWWYMWLNLKNWIRFKNAIIQAAQVLWINNPKIREKLEAYSWKLRNEVRETDICILWQQFDIEA